MGDFSDWFGKSIGVVDARKAGGELAFPGVKNGVTVAEASRMRFRGLPIDAFALTAKVDVTVNDGRPALNAGWEFCVFGLAGSELIDPVTTVTLNPWDPLTTRAEYQSWEAKLEANLVPTAFEQEKGIRPTLSRRRRLEGVVGLYDPGTKRIHWDLVRIFRVKDALKNPYNGSTDWIAFKTSDLPGNEEDQQEGGGHGPPR